MPRTASSLVVLLHFAALTQAYKTFETICSTPNTTVDYVSSADTRGTLEIIWSCLFTIFACAWAVQHLNVPEQREDRDPGWRGDIKWAVKRTWTSAVWLVVTIIAPELVYAKNVGDWQDVRIIDLDGSRRCVLSELQDFARTDGVPWTKTHSMFANMGGFVVRSFDTGCRGITESARETVDPPFEEIASISGSTLQDQTDIRTTDQEVRIESVVNLEPEGIAVPEENLESGNLANEPKIYYLIGPDILDLRRSGILPRLPYIPKEELYDKGKRDGFVLFIAVSQTLWMVAQMISRAYRHLAISQLEVAAMAFAAISTIIYLGNWSKPKGVRVPYTLLSYHGAVPFSFSEKLVWRRKKPYDISTFEKLISKLGLRKTHRSNSLTAPIPNSRNLQADLLLLYNSLQIGALVYGSVHIAAWHFVFPTYTEKVLWQLTSLLLTISCTLFLTSLLYVWMCSRCFCLPERLDYVPVKITAAVCILAYILGRLFLIAESFRALLFLPPSAFVATWVTNIPHVA
jgi:hypothetical protein